MSAGGAHACGVTTDNVAYCWGANSFGQLGDGSKIQRHQPVPVAGGHKFELVAAGEIHTCAITPDDRAWCWGNNDGGQLGTGVASVASTVPVAVKGGHRFVQITAGEMTSCAVDQDHNGFCWGSVFLGSGASESFTPGRIAGGLKFRQVSAGFTHSCGTTTSDKAYCWGVNSSGELGDGTHEDRGKPVLVVGGLKFRQVRVGSGSEPGVGPVTVDIAFSCGVTEDDKAYCWGEGALGNGLVQGRSATPVRVAGGRRFKQVAPGERHGCGTALSDLAYCWGDNSVGQLGSGGGSSGTPVAVAGGLRFDAVSPGGDGSYTCGVALSHRLYCWGLNGTGELGDGTTTNRPTPVPVANP